MCILIAIYVSVDCQVLSFECHIICLNNCHTWATSMPVDCQVRAPLIAIYVPVDAICTWAFCGPGQLPHMGQFCACSLPRMCLLIAMSVPVDCHMWASCLPHRCLDLVRHMWARQRPHMWAPHVRGPVCKTRVAHMCALGVSHFNCHPARSNCCSLSWVMFFLALCVKIQINKALNAFGWAVDGSASTGDVVCPLFGATITINCRSWPGPDSPQRNMSAPDLPTLSRSLFSRVQARRDRPPVRF